jgi:hypothetical protein
MLIRIFKGIIWSIGFAFLVSTILIPIVFGGFEHAIDYLMDNYVDEFIDSSDYDESEYRHETDDSLAYDGYNNVEDGYNSEY